VDETPAPPATTLHYPHVFP